MGCCLWVGLNVVAGLAEGGQAGGWGLPTLAAELAFVAGVAVGGGCLGVAVQVGGGLGVVFVLAFQCLPEFALHIVGAAMGTTRFRHGVLLVVGPRPCRRAGRRPAETCRTSRR